ncbi:Kelch repeat-containing protein [Sabulicella glaciei]|uniref:Galactose oxidase n=1 Tax=Sabulicella glaciei TaxID=2984948 RepID=A0ABT3NRP8_9PROT|nr:kelch repeat-containing protein [Roseococcus sp. MDT2-1-1]MCW8084839.1 galactose oxidase [Roseococcus sp. MDT2-1-1]
MNRRHLLAAGAVLLPGAALAQHHGAQQAPALRPMTPSPEPFHNLFQGGAPHHITPEQAAQRVTDSPAPAGPAGRWIKRADMPIPRSEMAWATAWNGRMHVVGGYGEGRVNRAYHTVYDPARDQWLDAAPLPRGANHVAVVADAGRVYALGGFIEQNRRCDDKAFFYDVARDRWQEIAPLLRPRGAAAATVLDGKIHLIGGATDPAPERASIAWHEVYDPQADKWELRRPLPAGRDHVGCVTHDGVIHVVGGRFNTFQYNTGMHHVYLPARDTWEERAKLPTARSGHGMVIHKGRFYVMGGEGGILERGQARDAKVFGQMESYDPASDTWQSHAPMPTPRHAVAAVAIGDWIYVAGGGAVLGGAVQSAIHEAWTLG